MVEDGDAATSSLVLWWIVMPIALVMAIWYVLARVEMRYVIASVAAFFILTGIGLAAIDDARWRLGLLVLVVALSLKYHVVRDLKPHDIQWREAAVLALATARQQRNRCGAWICCERGVLLSAGGAAAERESAGRPMRNAGRRNLLGQG